MSYHIVTLLQPGIRLSVDRGFMVCTYPDRTEKRLPLMDVRSVVVSVPSVSFSNEVIARLLAQDSPILHCDKHYKPIGWSVALDRVIRKEVFENQVTQNVFVEQALWKAIVLQKMKNQSQALTMLNVDHELDRLINKPLSNEANVSKQYWGHFFPLLGEKQKRERQGAETFENKALNYGYAVISTLVHRAILIYGLLPSLGIHHESRFRSSPLVYDLMEPFRPFVDYLLVKWAQDVSKEAYLNDEEARFKSWVQFLMPALRDFRIKPENENYSYKLMDAIDRIVRSVATCFETKFFQNTDITPLWLPEVQQGYWHKTNSDEQLEQEEDETELLSEKQKDKDGKTLSHIKL